ncbi:hypothetical protein EYF80_030355 [Liparis tanakae]|uniref:Uncharacterized protein n=1 Tax=Liparis tanakae TaxID=230148 RepID=A0A4Z2H1W3_9TELE|nr:hypothetical protein EYF80_030355 [Liparis tanakae]
MTGDTEGVGVGGGGGGGLKPQRSIWEEADLISHFTPRPSEGKAISIWATTTRNNVLHPEATRPKTSSEPESIHYSSGSIPPYDIWDYFRDRPPRNSVENEAKHVFVPVAV